MSQWSELSLDERITRTVIESVPQICPHCKAEHPTWIITGDACLSFNIKVEPDHEESSIGDTLTINFTDDDDTWQVQCGECGENIPVDATNSDLESVALRREFA